MRIRLSLLLVAAIVLACCRPSGGGHSLDVQVIVDGLEQSVSVTDALTVDQLLVYAQIELGPSDRISHPLVAQITDGMRLTIRRVREEEYCERQAIAYRRLVTPKESVSPGGKQLGQAGSVGVEEACYRVVLEDGEETRRELIAEPVVVTAPVDEIIYIGPEQSAEPIAIAGRLSYINHGDAWTVPGNSANKTPLTTGQNLDSLVFHQSENGAVLVFTSETDPADDFFNELWIVATDGRGEALRLTPSDVLFAQWRPRSSNTLAYSTGERIAGAAGWKALNNLWLMQIELESGRALAIEEALPESNGGFLGWWGTHFSWSPLGDRMAWVRPDGYGLVDFARRLSVTLGEYAVFPNGAASVWLSSISWSFDSSMLVSTVHGLPLGNEPAETSPIFDVSIASADGRFTALLQEEAGMWASPAFSPGIAIAGDDQKEGLLAWLQARDPRNSLSAEYDLVIADRDGSNQRHLFPPPDAPGVRTSDFGLAPVDFAWSPDARHIAVTYLGDIWLVDVRSGDAVQLTFDSGSSNPVWTG